MREDHGRPGDYGLTQIGGIIGFLVSICQVIIGDGSRWTHSFLIVDARRGIAVEARPSGARYVNYIEEYGDRDTVYSHLDLTDEQRDRIVIAARAVIGRGYNWADYLALALAHWGIRPRWLMRYIANTKRLICSQLCDEILRLAGVHLFTDGRAPQDVTPGALGYVGHVY